MAITDQVSIRYCNELIRSAADDAARSYYKAKALLDRWTALGLATTIPNDTTAIGDGSPTDGRPALTGAQVWGMVNVAQNIITQWEATNGQVINLILSVAVNP